MESLIYLVAMLAIYFLPLIVASTRGKANTLAIGMLNLLLGWTMIGWVVALVWACTAEQPRANTEGSGTSTTQPQGMSTGAKAIIAIVIGVGILGGIGVMTEEADRKAEPVPAVDTSQ